MTYGGWSDLDPDTYERPDFYQHPTRAEQWDMWHFVVAALGFFTLPHMLQRIYIARDLYSFKIASITILGGVWVLYIPGVYLGTMAVSILADRSNVVSPFGALLDELMSRGGFSVFVSYLTFIAIIASCMSTVRCCRFRVRSKVYLTNYWMVL